MSLTKLRLKLCFLKRKLADSSVETLSSDTRLELAYTVILLSAAAALRAAGFRVVSMTSHHYITIKTLGLTVGAGRLKVLYFQALREKRNLGIYSPSGLVTDVEVKEAVTEAEKLLKRTQKWLDDKFPDLK